MDNKDKESTNNMPNLKIVHHFPEKSEYGLMLNKLCNIEDWDNAEIKKLIKKLQTTTVESYLCQKDWSIIKGNIFLPRKLGVIHRKDWEWSMGILAMQRLNKLNKNNTALGIGVGREENFISFSKQIETCLRY